MDRLLERQILKTVGTASRPPNAEEWTRFLESVESAYKQATEDRKLLERSLELASREMLERHAALRAEASILSTTLESTGDAIAVLDAEGHLKTFNQNYLDMWGFTREFVLTATPDERLAHATSRVVDPAAALARIEEIFADERGATSDILELVDGRVIACETRPQMLEGQPVGRVWSFRDVTARHTAEAALRGSEARSRALIENISDVITITDEDGRYTFVSPSVERILGYTPAELEGRSIREFVHPEDAPRIFTALAALSREGGHVRSEFRYRHKDGSWCVLESLRVDARGTPGIAGFLGVARDVTETRRLQSEALAHRDAAWRRERLSALGTLVAGVAHEINNPMTFIVGNLELAELILDELPADERTAEIRRHLKVALAGTERVGRITRSLKAVAKPGAVDQHAVVVLREVVESVADLLFPVAHSGIEVVLAAHDEDLKVLGDADQLHQVVLNLAKNAIEAVGDAKGAVTIELLRSGANAELRVRDTGPGIAPDVQARLFTPFFTTKAEGTGLGLPIVHTIVKSHGGDIFVSSSPAAGTTFTVKLPLLRPQQATPAVYAAARWV